MDKSLIFSIDRYPGNDNFCDRKQELNRLLEMFRQRRHGVIYSYRRLGKTGLIQHFHDSLNKKRKVVTVYVDVMDTRSDSDFINKLVSACLKALESKKKGIVQKTIQVFSSLRPSISFDPMTNMPSVNLDIRTARDVNLSLNALMTIIAESKYTFQIAIDEFQQISKYKEDTIIDASLRAHFQTAGNIHYVFSGSERHLLMNLFSLPDKPLYAAIEMLHLDYIDKQEYAEYILKQFKKLRTKISDSAIEEILTWTNCHTFYTQYMCNKLQAKAYKKIDLHQIDLIKKEILYQYEMIYVNFKKLLRKNQWDFLVAVAKEGSVVEYTSKDFLAKYNLAQSSAKQALEALVDKSMLIEKLSKEKTEYLVYDVFLWRWAERYG